MSISVLAISFDANDVSGLAQFWAHAFHSTVNDGATKAALASLARSWAAEYGSAGIRVNAVSPGPVYTNAAGRELFDASAETTLLGRAAEPQEIADLIGFLASPRAAYITGTNIAVDGGSTGA